VEPLLLLLLLLLLAFGFVVVGSWFCGRFLNKQNAMGFREQR
jgi:flagellar biogenesis protein FliO